MNLCSDGHDEVCFEVRQCPVCDALGELSDAEEDIEELKDEIEELKNASD